MIKIVNGVFGYNNGKSIIPKTSKDEPFECDPKVEKRLVAQGVAVYVGNAKADETNPEADADTEETKELDKEALIARYKELGLGGNPASWKAETILKKIEEAEAADSDEDAPSFDEEDGVVN